METKAFERYYELQHKINELKTEQDEVKKEMEAITPSEGYKTEFITVNWTIRPKWTYSPAVKDVEQKLKTIKKEEEESGVAKKEEQKILTVRVK